MSRNWFVYILICRDGSYYTGITTDPGERLEAHNDGKGCDYTRRRGPVRLVYTEPHPDKSSARKRELEIKGWSMYKKEELTKQNI
jgi:putative endonuclease